MSKPQLKKFLNTLTHEQLVQVILDTYDARKEAKEYLEYFMNPDDKAAHEKTHKAVFNHYFDKKGKTRGKVSVKDANRTVADFIKLEPEPDLVADILFYHFEVMASRLVLRGVISESAWGSALTAFTKAADYAAAYGLASKYDKRVAGILDYAGKYSPSWLNVAPRMRQQLEECGFTGYESETKEESDDKA